MDITSKPSTGELVDIVAMLADQRNTFLIPMRGISEEQSRTRSTTSQLTLGSLVKHVASVEASWIKTLQEADEDAVFNMDEGLESHTVHPEETFEKLLQNYQAGANTTAEAIASIEDLDLLIPLPSAPWQSGREYWTVRRILLHILRETAQHSGHADIIREQLDGASTTLTMGADAGMNFD
ncbi:Protein of unknown function [Arthrobacter alpinus]|uniref:DinB family protein n=1 Tax=Arthrobacter alpinus TaxID=656366 RepID=A0A1H5N2P1_9MICC|nr:DinB family protein [Arthrobacter alpinus]SEE95217.1 Protein of unknown function [Arthrobacter alpinus]